jgi:hypothetical protein
MKKLLSIFVLLPLFSFSQFMHLEESGGLIHNNVCQVLHDLQGNVWVGTEGGISRISNGVITNFNTSNGLLSDGVSSMAVDHNGNVWVGSSNGVCFYDGLSWQYPIYSGVSFANMITDIEIADNGDVWLSSYQGIWIYNGNSFYSLTIAHGLPMNFIKYLAKSDDGTMWAATPQVLCRYDNPYFTNFNTNNGLPANFIYELYASDHVYLYTEDGMCVYNGTEFVLYTDLEFDVVESYPSPSEGSFSNIFTDHNQNTWLCFVDRIVKMNDNFQPDFVLSDKNITISGNIKTATVQGDTVYIGTNEGLFYSTTQWIEEENVHWHADTLDVNLFEAFALQTGLSDEDFLHQSQGLWIGGMDDNNEFHMATGLYGRSTYSLSPIGWSGTRTENWSLGPIDSDFNSIDHLGYWHYPRKVYQYEIDNHIANWSSPGYLVPESIAAWPEEGYYLDYNSNGNYDPENGDYPIIRGDGAVLSISNDAFYDLDIRQPLNVQVQTLTYAYDAPSDSALNNTYFINYRIQNKSDNNYSSVYLGVFRDFDLGGAFDDYFGTDTVKNMIYVYNSDNDDQFYPTGSIPAIGISILNTKMTSALYIANPGYTVPMSAPQNSQEVYNYLTGFWKDGSPITYGGNGYGGDSQARYVFPGDPVSGTGWTAIGESLEPLDAKTISVVGPFDLPSGGEICLDMAVSKATFWGATNLMSVRNLQSYSSQIHSWYQAQDFTCDSIITEPIGSFSIYAQDIEICENHLANIQLTSTRSGGVYPFTYQWADDEGTFTDDFHSPFITPPLEDTDYYVSVTDANGVTLIDTLTVVVNPLPEVNIGNDTLICLGESLQIDAGEYDAYHWNVGMTTSSLLVNDAGTYSVTITENACTAEDEIHVEFSVPYIGLSEHVPVCEGGNLELEINDFPTIEWENGETINLINIDASLYDQDYISVTVTDSIGCQRSDSTFITIVPNPEVFLGNDTSILDTQTVVLDANTGPGAIYNWYNGEEDAYLVFEGSQGEGVYDVWVHVTDVNGCETQDEITVTVDVYVSIIEKGKVLVKIYPNPASDMINLTSSIGQRHEFKLYNQSSQLVKTGQLKEGNNVIDISKLSKGQYYIKIEALNFVEKIILE